MGEFDGKVAIVTGAARGIGRASALAFARRGAAVVVCDVLDPTDTAREIAEIGAKALSLRTDAADGTAVRGAVDSAVSAFGRLDYAHNNAGTFSPAPLADLDEAEWERVISINLTGVFLCMKYEIPHLLKSGGAIVNTASIWSFAGATAQAAYVASKHGVAGLTRTAAQDYGKRRHPGQRRGPRADRHGNDRRSTARGDGTGDRADDRAPLRPAGRDRGGGRVVVLRRCLLHQRRGPARRRRLAGCLNRTRI
jgi:NAD(P)-dependent dehydrogenase (short-subunit alcohol dehydrogenase family)